jgi:hypothetical protein
MAALLSPDAVRELGGCLRATRLITLCFEMCSDGVLRFDGQRLSTAGQQAANTCWGRAFRVLQFGTLDAKGRAAGGRRCNECEPRGDRAGVRLHPPVSPFWPCAGQLPELWVRAVGRGGRAVEPLDLIAAPLDVLAGSVEIAAKRDDAAVHYAAPTSPAAQR